MVQNAGFSMFTDFLRKMLIYRSLDEKEYQLVRQYRSKKEDIYVEKVVFLRQISSLVNAGRNFFMFNKLIRRVVR